MTYEYSPSTPIQQEIYTRLEVRLGDVKREFGAPLFLGGGRDDLSGYAVGSYDVVVSVLGATGAENSPEYILQAGRLLQPDGLFLGAMLGAESFKELRAVAPLAVQEKFKLLPDVRDVGGVLQKFKFALPVVDRDVMTLTFSGIEALQKMLVAEEFDNLVGGIEWLEDAPFLPRKDGLLAVTLEVVYAHGWFPHKGQPKALPAGSGAVNLADVLG